MALQHNPRFTAEFALIRILGNSLPPRHAENEMLEHLAFILDNEPELDNCEKIWVLNRIANPALQQRCAALITRAGYRVIQLPFDLDDYAKCFSDMSGVDVRLLGKINEDDPKQFTAASFALEWKLRHKSLYAINLNQARNMALNLGRGFAKWTLPWDAACFVTAQAWDEVQELAASKVDSRYLVVPMARVKDFRSLRYAGFRPNIFTEPQLIFRHDSQSFFDERLRYGNGDKAELLVRLGVPGPWQQWRFAGWDSHQPLPCPERGLFAQGGWVARLPAGCDPGVEEHELLRWRSRFTGVAGLCHQLDTRVVCRNHKKARLLCYHESALARTADHRVREWVQRAECELEDPMLLVKSGCHDRAGLQEMIEGVCRSTLAGYCSGVASYSERALQMLTAWFITPTTRMDPQIAFAHRQQPDAVPGQVWDIADFRDLWALLDAITLLHRAGTLAAESLVAIQSWFAELLQGMDTSATQENNHVAVWSDLTKAAVGAFLGRHELTARILADAPLRISTQLTPFAVPAVALQRSRPLHYGLLLAQGLANLAWLGRRLGVDLWRYQASQQRSVAMLIRFLAQNRTLLDDYSTDPQGFDVRIAMVAKLVPADAAGYAALKLQDLAVCQPAPGDVSRQAPEFGITPYFAEFGPASL